MTSDVSNIVAGYFNTYLNPAPVQDPDASGTDPQLSSLITTVIDRMQRLGARGVLLDIGCGKGTLLQRLINDDVLSPKSEWIYVAVDSDENLDIVQRVSREAKISRRVEPRTLDEFYADWPYLDLPQLIFCRNVFHELTIEETARLLSHVVANFRDNDVFICQDLMAFPQGERHNACWFPDELATCMREHGFTQVISHPVCSKSGVQWFNIIAEQLVTGEAPLPHDKSRQSVIFARQRQWHAWTEIERIAHCDQPDRKKLVQTFDLDLQLAALTRQLKDVGAFISLNPEIEKRVRKHEIHDLIKTFVDKGALANTRKTENIHFRERGEQLNVLEEFLRSGDVLAAVTGGGGVGKTTLVEHVLAVRSYNKSVVRLDAIQAKDLWSFVEILFSELGLRFSPERLGSLEELAWSNLEISLRQFANKLSSRFILFIDNFDALIDTNFAIQDRDIASALTILAKADGAKIIVAQRGAQLPEQLIRASNRPNPSIVRLGRYGTEQTVINILDDHFDRAGAGFETYPARLLKAIDRHPLATKLAGEILRKHGSDILENDRLFLELAQHLYRELWSRLVDQQSETAVQMASNLRVPVPQRMLVTLSSGAAVCAGLASAALYEVKDRRWENLVATLGTFRKRDITESVSAFEQIENDKAKHALIANCYLSIYRDDDNPKWLRESYFHRMLGGDGGSRIELGRYYFSELIASADYCFKKQHDYQTASELYDSAAKLGALTEGAQMHAASCRIRLNNRPTGDEEFAKLIEKYSRNIGMRTSYVDALLFVRDFACAKQKLTDYRLEPEKSGWIAGQWGRVWLGLNDYKKAESMFRKQLAGSGLPDAIVYLNLSRALLYQGAVGNALEILSQGIDLHQNNLEITVAIGACLERMRRDEDALALLLPLFKVHPDRTDAALPIIKVMGRLRDNNNILQARRIFERAKKHASTSVSSLLITTEAELLKLENNSQGAVELLLGQPEKDQHSLGMLFECWYHFALTKSDRAERIHQAQDALAVDVPQSLNNNIPLLINRCRLAALAQDRSLYDSLLDAIGQSRVDSFEIRNLESLW